jgi:acyl carrier protein
MDRRRIREEVIEILANKLHKLPPPPPSWDEDEEEFDYDAQVLKPDVTDNHLDIAEVSMDLEDAFGINFDDSLPGDQGLETIGKVIDFIEQRVTSAHQKQKKSEE